MSLIMDFDRLCQTVAEYQQVMAGLQERCIRTEQQLNDACSTIGNLERSLASRDAYIKHVEGLRA